MARKKKKSKEVNIVFVISVIVIIVALIFVYLSYQEQEKKINEANKLLYDSLLCISDCPVTILFGTSQLQAIFDEQCTDNCRTEIENIGST